MSRKNRPEVEVIPVHAYPQMLSRHAAAQFVNSLKSKDVRTRVSNALTAGKHALFDVVRSSSARLDAELRKGDMAALLGEAYEIRGLAETAGLTAAGRIAEGLCFYLNAAAEKKLAPDLGVVSLHVDAVIRAANAQDEATRLGTEVANELRSLVQDRLGLRPAPAPGRAKREPS